MTSRSDTARIPELDGLRGLAIGMVLLWHYVLAPVVATPGTAFSYLLVFGRLTWSGVDLFFVLSGFLIGGILLDARGAANYFQVFYTRRFFRIVPIYAVFLLSAGLLMHFSSSGMMAESEGIHGGKVSWWYYPAFLQNIGMSLRNGWGTFPLGVTWSLAVEEQFYLTLPLLIRFLDRRALIRFVLIAILGAPLLRTFFFHRDSTNLFTWYTLMPCRMDSLLLGVVGAIVVRDARWREWLLARRRFMLVTLAVLLLGVAFLGWRASSSYDALMATAGFTWLALTYLAFLLYALFYRDSWVSQCLRWSWLRGLGVIAYGTYLFHEVFVGIFFRRFPWLLTWRDAGLSVIVLTVMLIFCRLSWIYFEKPLVKLGHRSSYEFGPPGLTKTQPAPAEGG